MGARGPYLPSVGIGKYCRFLSRQMGKDVVVRDSFEEGLPPVTTEGDEVGVFEFVETVQASRQGKEYKSKIS